jgi:hypothetical protein
MGQLHKNVLAVSPDRNLAQSRQKALSRVGFFVISVFSDLEARWEISLGRCGILLLCHKLRTSTRDELASYFHQHCPEPFVVAILSHHGESRPPHAHVCVVHSDDHVMLVEALRKKVA